jgi:hypothetical protein
MVLVLNCLLQDLINDQTVGYKISEPGKGRSDASNGTAIIHARIHSHFPDSVPETQAPQAHFLGQRVSLLSL